MNNNLVRALRILPDKIYIQLMYYHFFHKFVNFRNPVTYNEKLQWLKVNYRNPEYTKLVDKHLVKEVVANKIGEEYVLPTYGVYSCPEEIDFDELPNQFVLKCNHDSGSVAICKDKSSFNKDEALLILRKGLRRNGYWYGREWPYKHVKPLIIAEKYIEDSTAQDLKDYKFFCFDGYVDNVMMVVGRHTDHARFYHFDRNWHICHYNRLGRKLPDDFTLPKPQNIDKMFELAEKLSKGFPEVRIDLFNVDGHIYFGEYTFFNESGFETGFDFESDKHLGDLIELPPVMK